MRLNRKSFGKNFSIKDENGDIKGGNTASWATPLGQSVRRHYKIKEDLEGIDDLIRGMVYCSVPVRYVKYEGRNVTYAGTDDNNPIVIASLFKKVYFNDVLIDDANFILMIIKEDSVKHKDRLQLKYSDKASYNDGNFIYNNQMFFQAFRKKFSLSENACYFVEHINVEDQDKLILTGVILDKNDKVIFESKDEMDRVLDAAFENGPFNLQYSKFFEIEKELKKHDKNKEISVNTILYGAPGTGKTYKAPIYALSIIENKNVDAYLESERLDNLKRYNNYLKQGNVVFTTFHQNYTYEDFIQGIRPSVENGAMSFEMVDGVLKNVVNNALQRPDEKFVIIIDEINRANISKVFGELITLIEPDKRLGGDNVIIASLPSGEAFTIPNNLYILGTMNSADKSISLIDVALRRRFEFIEFRPDSTLIDDPTLENVFNILNHKLENQLKSSDLLIGHSYFINKEATDLPDIMNKNIIPLLYEYFFDNKEKVISVLDDALKGTGYEVDDSASGRVRVRE